MKRALGHFHASFDKFWLPERTSMWKTQCIVILWILSNVLIAQSIVNIAQNVILILTLEAKLPNKDKNPNNFLSYLC